AVAAPCATVGRPAPARRAGARAGAAAAGVPARRAAVQPRRPPARRHAGGDRAPAPAAGRNHALCHPRPGRGDDARPAHRGDAGRTGPADRHADALYRRPANLFVATFLGSPAMNVLPGTLLREDGWWLLLGDGTRLPLPAGDDGIDPGLAGQGVQLGVRPEHLLQAAPDEGFAADVDVIEPVGSDVHAYLRLGGH